MFVCLFVYLFIYLFIYYVHSMYAWRPKEGTRSHYRWLWATMWLLGIERRTSGRTVSALKCWAISPALIIDFHTSFIFLDPIPSPLSYASSTHVSFHFHYYLHHFLSYVFYLLLYQHKVVFFYFHDLYHICTYDMHDLIYAHK